MKKTEKKLLVLVSRKEPQWLGKKKNVISKCKLRLLEPRKQPHLKMKMFFERETINPNNEK